MINVTCTPEGKRIATCLEEWKSLKVIELSVLTVSMLHGKKGIESTSLFRAVKDARCNPFLSDVVIAKVVERMHYRGLIKITAIR